MRITKYLFACAQVLALCTVAVAQVVNPVEIKDPKLSDLQRLHFDELKEAGNSLTLHAFPYPFYFSRKLDIDEKQQKQEAQQSIRFDQYDGKTVLEVTGNYYASYSTELMSQNQRALRTFQDVVVPILSAVAPPLSGETNLDSFAVEVSHHVRKKVMGVQVENPENIVILMPRDAALRLVHPKDANEKQAALLEARVFLDSEPLALFVSEPATRQAMTAQNDESLRHTQVVKTDALPVAAPTASISRAVSQEELAEMQKQYKTAIDSIVHQLDAQAHFVSYAPPAFITFHQGAYLEFSLKTTLDTAPGASRYRLAALAFDDHISHLVRPTVGALPDGFSADGLAFSTSIVEDSKEKTESSEAVEFFFPIAVLRCYVAYDCTGQQLIDAGYVLINGERVKLDLQSAEAGVH